MFLKEPKGIVETDYKERTDHCFNFASTLYIIRNMFDENLCVYLHNVGFMRSAEVLV